MRAIGKLAAGLVIIALAISVLAGTLDEAPFLVRPPGKAWSLNESIIQPKGKGVYIVASLTNVQSGLSARITKTEFAESPAQNLDQICDGVRASFVNSPLSVKPVGDEALTFLGNRARRFSFQTFSKSRPPHYNEAVIFVVGRTGWTIDCKGALWQTNEVRQFFSAVSPKPQRNK